MRATSGGAGGMTASAILGQQGFAALQGRAPLLCRQRGQGTHRDSGEEKPEQELDVHAELAPSVTGHVANLLEQRIPQQRLLDNGNGSRPGARAHRRTRVAGNQDRRR